ncbi:MAG: methyltransferase [Sulfurospirillaceae bacterium]|nr:methyltransferase [Sulfurospirillaceae bacterium]MDD3462738.1 methyltransferase [Sulfurospirillaceae bacterium]
MNLYQLKSGYRYNSDTLLLYDFASFFIKKGSVLDVGCGCGILGLLLKRDFPSILLEQIDIQQENVSLAEKNANENNLHVTILCGNFLTQKYNTKYDYIVSNPPFYYNGGTKSDNKHLSISRDEEHLPFEQFAKKSSKILANRGSLIFCYDARRLDYVCSCLSQNGLKIQEVRFVHARAGKEASLVLIHARKNSKTLCKVLPPICVYEGEIFSQYVQDIYKKSATKSIDCPQ